MDADTTEPGAVIRRQSLSTRIWHWVNAVTIFIMLGSGLGISNAHPYLYWGSYGANYDPHWLAVPRFPSAITIPSTYNLAISRRWHILFALVLGFGLLAFMIASLINRHFRRDLRLRASELAPRSLWRDLLRHWNFRFHDPDHPRRYNIFQKLSYILVIFVLIPLMILSGLAISPGMDAVGHWLPEVFGGRQSARSIHFIAANLIGLFVIVHLVLVILAGAANEVRSIVTGYWRIPDDAVAAEAAE